MVVNKQRRKWESPSMPPICPIGKPKAAVVYKVKQQMKDQINRKKWNVIFCWIIRTR